MEFQEDKAKKEEEEEEETPEWMVVTEIAEQIRMDLERCYPEGCEGKTISPQSIGLFDSKIDSQN